MSDASPAVTTLSFRSLDFARAGSSLAGWSSAWAQVAQGLISAGLAQAELARSLCTEQPAAWQQASGAGAPNAIARHMLQTGWSQFEFGVKGMRRINDTLATTLFAAAETLIDGPVEATPDAGEPAVLQAAEEARKAATMAARAA